MNFRQIVRLLSIVAFFTGGMMFLALPWGFEQFGGIPEYEEPGIKGLFLSIGVSFGLGFLLRFCGRGTAVIQSRKDLLAVVPLSWFLVVVLSALPFIFSGTFMEPGKKMGIADALFESTSGITTTGATVLAELEDPSLVPRSILFWRSETLFIGGLGIMVFFVAFLGYGTVGKRILSYEKGGTNSLGNWGHSRKFALSVAGIYVGLIVILTILLRLCGLTGFDSLCHAFSTISTGGFSTYNASIGHFAGAGVPHAFLIEAILIFFMVLGGTNFVLLYLCSIGKPGDLFRDTEWRAYILIILAGTLIIFLTGHIQKDFDGVGTVIHPSAEDTSAADSNGTPAAASPDISVPWYQEVRYSLFHVVSIMTGTGFATDEFEKWNGVSLMVFLILMSIGGCIGSASGGVKVLRTVTFVKAANLELEKYCWPSAVQKVKIAGEPMEDVRVRSMLVYILLFFVSVLAVTMIVAATEPSTYWVDATASQSNRIFDLYSSTLAMFANVGPAFGIVGANENYAGFSLCTKLLYTFSMLFGRLEICLPLLMFSPSFWKK